MQKTSLIRRLVVGGMVALTLVLSTAQCFGGFGLTRKLYQFNKSVMASDNTFVGRFVRTIVMWIMAFIPIYGIGMFLDLVLFNLIEFWTGQQVIASANPDDPVTFTQVNENEMRVDIKDGKISSFHVFRDRPGEFFVKEGAVYLPVIMPEDLHAFDGNGLTTMSCERTEAAVICREGTGDRSSFQAEVRQDQYNRLQYRTRLALGIGAEAAVR